MVDAISTILSASNLTASLGSCRVVSAPHGDVIRVTPDRLLGTTSLEVEVAVDPVEHLARTSSSAVQLGRAGGAGAALTHLATRLAALKAEIIVHQKCIVAVARGPLRVVATQVLLTALGLATLEQAHITQALPPDNPVVVKLAQMAFKSPEELQRLADELITRRNNEGPHWTSLKALEDEVESLQDLLTAPGIKQRCEWEAWVVENYDRIKQAFPAQFGQA
ncbi:hypothetical protein GPECTOR_15g329 [Gonium pectorale]|uniref:Uncharacterized protein n=1 Tax=Gonium pectorale TaxID=33097 RepID=A0A150GLM5_GONPE|nr:hypothetical protein GPECTOR_15g329 [Gonium pectorale]|eukprot:KXZ50645.1 hypothetical protein GPECTOR_15g329 [Gonium pectorale]